MEKSQETVVKETVGVDNDATDSVAPLLKRAFIFLEDGEWARADEFCEQVINQNPECAEAYLGKLMAESQCRKRENLKNCANTFDSSNNYQKAYKFGDESLKKELQGYIKHINERNENNRLTGIYNDAVSKMNSAKTEDEYKAAAIIFQSIPEFKDAGAKAGECLEKAEPARKDAIYVSASQKQKEGTISSLESAIKLYATIVGWKDADLQASSCQKQIEAEQTEKKKKNIAVIASSIVAVCVVFLIVLNAVILPSNNYKKAVILANDGKCSEAISAFEELDGFKDSAKQINAIKEVKRRKAIELYNSGEEFAAMGYFIKARGHKDSYGYLMNWNADSVSAGGDHSVGLKSDGKVVAVGYNDDGRCDVSGWKDIVAVSAGVYQTVGLKSDGKVVAVGSNGYGQCNTDSWIDIVAISADSHTVGLKSDGTAVAVGYNKYGQCNVSSWKDIVSVSAGGWHTAGLKSDGTVVAVGANTEGQCDVSGWKDIVAVSAGYSHTVGLKSDGTVVATEYTGDKKYYHGQCDVSGWEDIVAVSAGYYHTVGLKSDGTVVATKYTGDKKYCSGQCDVSGWEDIVAVSAGGSHTVGLKSDGTVIATEYTGDNYGGQCDVSDWKDIKINK